MMDNKDRKDMIIRNAAKLSEEDRVEVARRIMEETPVPDAVKRMAVVLPAAEKVVGRKLGRSRDRDNVTIRRIVSARLQNEGFRISHIAQAVGVNHSTVLFYLRQMRDIFDEPIFYADDIRLFMKFNDAVEEADSHVE